MGSFCAQICFINFFSAERVVFQNGLHGGLMAKDSTFPESTPKSCPSCKISSKLDFRFLSNCLCCPENQTLPSPFCMWGSFERYIWFLCEARSYDHCTVGKSEGGRYKMLYFSYFYIIFCYLMIHPKFLILDLHLDHKIKFSNLLIYIKNSN